MDVKMVQVANRGSTGDGGTRRPATKNVDLAEGSAASAGDAADAARSGAKGQVDLVGMWLDLAREQLDHNAKTLRRLGSVQDWRGFVELQREYSQRSFRLQMHGVLRQSELAGRMLGAGRR